MRGHKQFKFSWKTRRGLLRRDQPQVCWRRQRGANRVADDGEPLNPSVRFPAADNQLMNSQPEIKYLGRKLWTIECPVTLPRNCGGLESRPNRHVPDALRIGRLRIDVD